jgi:hypothetical protein
MTALPQRSPSAERPADTVARQVQRADPRLPRIDAEIGRVDAPSAAGSRLSSTPHRRYRALLTSRDAAARRPAAVQLARLSRPDAAPESSASDGRLVALVRADVGLLRRRTNGDLERRCPGGCGSERAASQCRSRQVNVAARLTQRSSARIAGVRAPTCCMLPGRLMYIKYTSHRHEPRTGFASTRRPGEVQLRRASYGASVQALRHYAGPGDPRPA